MKKIFLILLVLGILIIGGCSSKNQATGSTVQETKSFVCNKPYIQVGSECCLDQNDNKICDKDEQTITPTEEITTTTSIQKEVKELSGWSLTRFEPSSATSSDGNYFRFGFEIDRDYSGITLAQLVIGGDSYTLNEGGGRCGALLCLAYSCRPGSCLEDKYKGKHLVGIKIYKNEKLIAQRFQEEDLSNLPYSPVWTQEIQKKYNPVL